MVKQLSVFLENSPGRLANLIEALDKNRIKTLALGIAEAGNYGIVRMIVDNDEKALEVMHSENMAVNQSEVLIIDLASMGEAVRALGKRSINIDYAYSMEKGRLVIKVNKEDEAVKALHDAGLANHTKTQ